MLGNQANPYPGPQSQGAQQQQQQPATAPSTLNLKGSNTTSAPTSPHKGVSSFLSRATSLTGSVSNTVQQSIARVTSQAAAAIKDRHKILLVIDDQLIDWSKYFRGKRIFQDYEIKVEQAEFKEITLVANSELGALVSIHTIDRNGVKIARTFRPDFVLVRQHVRDASNDFTDIITGLMYGLVPSINSLQTVYNLQDKAWVFANLLAIQRKVLKDNFPLIEQTFYPNNKELSQIPKFPCVVKIGQSHNGLGKIKVENLQQYQDIRSVLLVSKAYCTIEPFIDAKCDLLVQKIGTSYKAFSRKSVSGNWKANVGSALLEQVPVSEKMKRWIDDTSEMFGGLEICSVEAVVGKDGKEYILEVCGSTLTLLGESQEEDRRNISDLIVQRMNAISKATLIKQQSRASFSSHDAFEQPEQAVRPSRGASITSLGGAQVGAAAGGGGTQVAGTAGMPPPAVPPPPAPVIPNAILNRRSSKEGPIDMNANVPARPFNETNPFATAAEPFSNMANSEPPNQDMQRPVLAKRDSQSTVEEIKDEVDDTMRNLRKTFAGIFGDM